MHATSQAVAVDLFVFTLLEGLSLGTVLNHRFLRSEHWNAVEALYLPLQVEVAGMRKLVDRVLLSVSASGTPVPTSDSTQLELPVANHVFLGDAIEIAVRGGRAPQIGALYVLQIATDRFSEIVDRHFGIRNLRLSSADNLRTKQQFHCIENLLRSETLIAAPGILDGVRIMSISIGKYWDLMLTKFSSSQQQLF